jgi:tetratricopeptide (TPR) repeat protein
LAVSGRDKEALAQYDTALIASERAGLPAAERRGLLEARAVVQDVLGQFEPARADLEAAQALAEGANDVVAQGRLLTALGALWGGHRDYARGLALTRRAVDLLEHAGNRRALAEAHAQLGVILVNLARMSDSRRELDAALALFEELGDVRGQGRTLEMLTMNVQLSGDLDGAADLLERVLRSWPADAATTPATRRARSSPSSSACSTTWRTRRSVRAFRHCELMRRAARLAGSALTT